MLAGSPAILWILPFVVVCGLRDRKRIDIRSRHEAAVARHSLEHLGSALEQMFLPDMMRKAPRLSRRGRLWGYFSLECTEATKVSNENPRQRDCVAHV